MSADCRLRKICSNLEFCNCHSDRIRANLFWPSARKCWAVLVGLNRDPDVTDHAHFCRVGLSTPGHRLCLVFQDTRYHLLPPGSFLAIEDWQESRQLPNGLWTQSITFNSMRELKNHDVHRYGRHNIISRVSCVPDKNNLQSIDGFRGSSYPDPPYFASVEDKLLGLETRSKPLSDNQILQSTGKF